MNEDEEPKSDAQRARTYYQRMRDRGLTRVSAWIPDDEQARAEFWDAVSELETRWSSRGLPTVET